MSAPQQHGEDNIWVFGAGPEDKGTRQDRTDGGSQGSNPNRIQDRHKAVSQPRSQVLRAEGLEANGTDTPQRVAPCVCAPNPMSNFLAEERYQANNETSSSFDGLGEIVCKRRHEKVALPSSTHSPWATEVTVSGRGCVCVRAMKVRWKALCKPVSVPFFQQTHV